VHQLQEKIIGLKEQRDFLLKRTITSQSGGVPSGDAADLNGHKIGSSLGVSVNKVSSTCILSIKLLKLLIAQFNY